MDILSVVDDTVASWGRVRPDLDFASMGTMMRLNALVHSMMRRIEEEAVNAGVTMGEFDVLATLRRHGDGATLMPSVIAEVALVSPSGLTHRLTQLEKAGHIARMPDPNDRRSSLISITSSGIKIADHVIQFIVQCTSLLFTSISETRQSRFAKEIDHCIAALDELKSADSDAA